ncbi:unnamed protein product, partial [Alternaria alternata]
RSQSHGLRNAYIVFSTLAGKNGLGVGVVYHAWKYAGMLCTVADGLTAPKREKE